MGKILVKAPQAMMSPSGEIQFLYGGGQGKGGDRGSLPARVLGGAGKFLGGLLGTTGRHQSIQSLLGGIQGGAATVEQAGRWVGGFADKLPGGRSRAARRKIRGERDDAYTQMAAEQRQLNPNRLDRASSMFTPFRNRRDRALDAYNLQMDEQKRGAKQAQRAEDWESNREQRNREMWERMVTRRRMQDQLDSNNRSGRDDDIEDAADTVGATEAETERALRLVDLEVADPITAGLSSIGLDTDDGHNTVESMMRNLHLPMARTITPPMGGQDSAFNEISRDENPNNIRPQNTGTGDAYSDLAANISRLQQDKRDEFDEIVNIGGAEQPWWKLIQQSSQGQPEAGAPPA